MNIGFTVQVLMWNDFPSDVFLTKGGLKREIARKEAAYAKKREQEPWNKFAPRPHLRGYEFPIGPQLRIPSLAELAWRRRMRG